MSSTAFLTDTLVALERSPSTIYDDVAGLRERLRVLTGQLGWANARSAFGQVIPVRARVLVKPNFVLHENQGPWPFDPVVTHPSVIRAVVAELLATEPDEVSVGDAPVQGCNFERLMERTSLGQWATELAAHDPRFRGIADFRRTVCVFKYGVRFASEDRVELDNYVLFDLAGESLLEPVSSNEPSFRVTCYDPELLAKTHFRGRHQYLITKAVLEADIVLNLPKLKMHRKAGITNALKNLVGINGNKEYLPHHRIGGSADSGDCYPGSSRLKKLAEKLLDLRNSTSSVVGAGVISGALKPISALLAIGGDETGLEGSWSGNDTVWRMALDLNRILVYGKLDGTLSDAPQRTILHISDAIVAGQGCGPLAPQPFDLGVLLAGRNPAAIDWVGSMLLNMDPNKISLLTGAFAPFRWPLVGFTPADVRVRVDGHSGPIESTLADLSLPLPTNIPPGWSSVVQDRASCNST
jgi:uncharacterized protein (DUF362 family)